MKDLKYIIILLLFSCAAWGQGSEVKSVKYYMITPSLRSKFPITTKNFKYYYKYFFQTKEEDIDTLFEDYETCLINLESQVRFVLPESVSYDEKHVCALVEITFEKRKRIKLYFDGMGNYCFKKVWYNKRNELYYGLFKYFSNYLVNETWDFKE
jgi:hypothetical protein